ncbi:MAG: histidine kinase [Calditrichaeota bacterium]|nr:histidine kinase [Calditrichota bacterium]
MNSDRRNSLIVLVIWVFISALTTGQIYFRFLAIGEDKDIILLLISQLSRWFGWILFIPLIYRAKTWIDKYRSFSLRISLHFILCFVLVAIYLLYYLITEVIIYHTDYTNLRYLYQFVSLIHWNVLIYLGILSTAYMQDYYSQIQNQQLLAARLENQLSHAQLATLRMQIQPHFLFNTLNTISSVMHKDIEMADKIITRMGDLLRRSLDLTEQQLITIEDEISFLKNYLDIESIRFQDRLTVDYEIDESSRDLKIPALILQPLVENALKHGLAKSTQGIVHIQIKTDGGNLIISITDNGEGFNENDEIKSGGIGLKNCRDRLYLIYGDSAKLTLENIEKNKTKAQLTIPLGLKK